jgi:zinc protease
LRNADQITDAVKRIGAQLTTASGRNAIGISMELIGTELPSGVALLSEILQQPVFSAAELEKEKSLALAHLKEQQEDPFAWGIRRLMRQLFSKHPYRLDPSGSEQSIQAISREACEQFYARAFDPRTIVVSVVGDFDPAALLNLLEQSLGRIEKNNLQTPVIEPEAPLTRRIEVEEKTPRHEQLVLIGFRGLKLGDPRIPALDLAEAVLSGGAGRLFGEVREKQGLAYTVGAFGVPGIDPGSFVIYAMADPENRARVEQSLWREIQRLREEPVPAKELEEAKQGLLGSHRAARQTQAAVAAQLATNELYELGYDYDERYEAMIQSLTPADLQRVAKELLNRDQCVVWSSVAE